MPNSKAKIAELVLRNLANGDVPNDFPVKRQEVVLLVSKAAQYLWDLDYKATFQQFGTKDIDTRWLTYFDDVPVLYDERKKLKYSIIPANYMTLPGHAGVYHIGPQEDQITKFRLVKANYLNMYDGLEAGTISSIVGFWPEGKRIYYTHKFDGVGYKCESVLMKLIVMFDWNDDYDEIFIPEKIEWMVIDTLVKYYKGQLSGLKDTVADDRFSRTTPQ